MGTSSELATTTIITEDGTVTTTVLDRVSPDRIALMLVRGSAAARYSRTQDNTSRVNRDIKDLIVFPEVET